MPAPITTKLMVTGLEQIAERSLKQPKGTKPIRLDTLPLLSVLTVFKDVYKVLEDLKNSPNEDSRRILMYTHPKDNSKWTLTVSKKIIDLSEQPSLDGSFVNELPYYEVGEVAYNPLKEYVKGIQGESPLCSASGYESDVKTEFFAHSLIDVISYFVEDYNTWFLINCFTGVDININIC